MFVEQLVREAWESLKIQDEERLALYFSPNAVALGGILPDTIPIALAFHIMNNLRVAIPDFQISNEVFEIAEDTVSVIFNWGGTHSGKFDLGIPGLPAILPTCKSVLVLDRFDFVVEDDQIIIMSINSPANGGMPAALRQIGSMMTAPEEKP